LVGTPVYMSPEQCQGMPATPASDLYSVGVILYEMCTGVYPFSGPTIVEYLTQHVSQVPPGLATKRNNLPRALDAVVQRALSKRPEARFASAGEFAQALAEACRRRSPRASKSQKNSSSQISTVVLGIVPILVSLVAAAWMLRPRPAAVVHVLPVVARLPPARPTPRPSPVAPKPTPAPAPSVSAAPQDLAEAEKQLRMAARHEPENAWNHYRLALFLQTHEKVSEAVREFRLAVKYRPNDMAYRLHLAEVLWDERECGELEALTRESLAKDPKDDQLQNYRALTLDRLGRGHEAEATFRSAIALAPENAVFRYNLGLLLQEMNRVEAIEQFQKAVALDPQYSEARLTLASVLEKKSKGESLRPGWCARQATGSPDAPEGEDSGAAWTPQGEDDGVEWLELSYLRPMRANAVFVYQPFNPGAVVRVILLDEHQQIMQSIPVTGDKAPVLAVRFASPPRPVKWVRLELDTAKVPGWNEIDAAELVGPEGRAWADEAHASSSFVDEGDQTAKE
jgi:tetratricopeptide (TPR) repeat protein